jgi:hypothetical protein
MKKIQTLGALSLAAFVGLSTLGASKASAGASYSSPATCTFNLDGSGWCRGTLEAFRASSDSTAYLALYSHHEGSISLGREVWLSFGGNTKVIVVPGTLPDTLLGAFDDAANDTEANIFFTWSDSISSPELESFQVVNDSRLLP